MLSMFEHLTDSIENALETVGGLMMGETPSTRQVARMINDGMTVAAIAATLGYSVELIERVVEDILEE